MIKGFLPEMQELPDCFCPLGSWLAFSVQVLLCRQMININYELLGHWKLLVLGVSACYLHRNEMEPELCSCSRKDEDNVSKTIFSGVSFAFSPRADPLGLPHPSATVAFIKVEFVLLPVDHIQYSMRGARMPEAGRAAEAGTHPVVGSSLSESGSGG